MPEVRSGDESYNSVVCELHREDDDLHQPSSADQMTESQDELNKLFLGLAISLPPDVYEDAKTRIKAAIQNAKDDGYRKAVADSKCGTNGCDRPRFDPKFMKCKG